MRSPGPVYGHLGRRCAAAPRLGRGHSSSPGGRPVPRLGQSAGWARVPAGLLAPNLAGPACRLGRCPGWAPRPARLRPGGLPPVQTWLGRIRRIRPGRDYSSRPPAGPLCHPRLGRSTPSPPGRRQQVGISSPARPLAGLPGRASSARPQPRLGPLQRSTQLGRIKRIRPGRDFFPGCLHLVPTGPDYGIPAGLPSVHCSGRSRPGFPGPGRITPS
jgi:hypothetical protein